MPKAKYILAKFSGSLATSGFLVERNAASKPPIPMHHWTLLIITLCQFQNALSNSPARTTIIMLYTYNHYFANPSEPGAILRTSLGNWKVIKNN